MRAVCRLSLLLLVLSGLPAPAAVRARTITFPCLKNLADGRVLVDGTAWDAKMRSLGYDLSEGAYVPYQVLGFTQDKVQDAIWAEGQCRMKLLAATK